MLILINFPKLKKGRENDFLQWFEWTNIEFQQFGGFVSRKLIKSKFKDDPTYSAIFEVKDLESFSKIHSSNLHKIVFSRVIPMLEGEPEREFYDVVLPLRGFATVKKYS